MKLYYSPSACSMSCHLALEIAGLSFELIYAGRDADPKAREDFLKVNPLGAVPALMIDNKKVLTQNIAILEYIADNNPEAGLSAPAGTLERAEITMWLSLIASDLHKSYLPFFVLNKISSNEETQADVKKWSTANIEKYLTVIDKHLQGKDYLVGDHITIADCYLFTVYQWSKFINLDTTRFQALNQYTAKMEKHPAVIAALKREKEVKLQSVTT
jgi:glutathione S-transferase